MTTEAIIESGMTFGPYPEGWCFYIGKSNCYKAIQDHVKMAEFLLLRANKKIPDILVVEAKQSTPHPKKQPNFDIFIDEIRKKLINAFSLGWASCLKRHHQAEAELPEGFKTLNLSQVDVKFILVVKGHQEAWLPPLQEGLGKVLRSTVKCWAFTPNSVAVINDVLARKYGLILSPRRDDA